ncbi:hypothetical protein [Curvibacter lanceolatus]|uniref:hypothetical protein n=1 Tax=Curvibacter lanceolatus TaxID=86182 RepID=UPI00036CFCD5|nr:hypothetical protein [Curvibacter lanceolatus]
MITTETATVYRGGGRRWFTKKAAIWAEAKKSYQACVHNKGRCECGSQFIDGFGQMDDYCHYHDRSQPVFSRYTRFVSYLIAKESP